MPQPKTKAPKSTRGKDAPKRPRKPTRKRLSTLHREVVAGTSRETLGKKAKQTADEARDLAARAVKKANRAEGYTEAALLSSSMEVKIPGFGLPRDKTPEKSNDDTAPVNPFGIVDAFPQDGMPMPGIPSEPDPNLCPFASSVDKRYWDLGNWLLVVVIINIVVVAADLIHRIAAKWLF